MASDETTRWTLTISKDTDVMLRSHLAQRGLKKGDLSKFVEEAVNWRVLNQTAVEVRSRFADLPEHELQSMIDEACGAVRGEMFGAPAALKVAPRRARRS